MAREFIVPARIISGHHALEEACIQLGHKALIVTDPMMVQLGNIEVLIKKLKQDQILYTVFDQITGEPTDMMIEAGVQFYKDNHCDFLIALGGGSAIDSMKAIGAMVTNKGKITDYLYNEIKENTPPMIAIPTTAGTGSEATQFTIITDTKNDIKMLLRGKTLIPDLAIIDARFSMTAPKKVTAATGLDALCHALESYTSKLAQPLSMSFSISALKRIFEYLPVAYQNGTNIEAREQMSLAALEAGIAFNNSSVTLIHGMSRPIGALYHIPHGLSNAILLEKCMQFAICGAYQRFGDLAKEIGIASSMDSDQKAAENLLNKVKELVSLCEIPSLCDYGVSPDNFFKNIPKMAEDAMNSGSPANTLRDCTIQDIEALYHQIIND
ncbi:iron-containing alcohol dehydrogenase [Faecalicoccus pleomorphus]|uniref:iron-containing alcohol dehydrogenase n=1 Tax=Faecalicoccus pleomorphus TaxID=1323 RepID=UPI00232AA153|nr:iron-containing alcohol dehydrogenase [Faecalicoccus pleomorphus]MDB7989038.1 iron-containing alcohol dehydrogenase [Faecalicoccus pleomorphus]MDB7993360.1 iron-containing alcohol dehydrogenase [Faecalicoccus pleomorphus]